MRILLTMPAVAPSPVASEPPRAPGLTFGPFAFDRHTRLLRREGREVPLPPRVLGVLELLLARAGDVVARNELIDTVWKDAFVTDTSLAEAVSVLRQALGDDPAAPTYIQTLHRRGYRFVAPVSAEGDRPATSEPSKAVAPERVTPSIARQLVPWSAAVICAILAAIAVWRYTELTRTATTPSVQFEVTTAPGTTFDVEAPALAVSVDGRQLAWSACDGQGCRIYRRALGATTVTPVPGTDNGHAPFFSPDATWIGFYADGQLRKVPLAGGRPTALAEAREPLGAVWIDRDIVFAGGANRALSRVAAGGGAAEPLTVVRETTGDVRHVWPSRVPGTDLVTFTIEKTKDIGESGTLAVASLGPTDLEWRPLIADVMNGRAIASDLIVFSRGSDLYAVRFNAARLVLDGVPMAVASDVAQARGMGHVAASATGTFIHAIRETENADAQLAWWATGSLTVTGIDPNGASAPTLSPDGRRVALIRTEGARFDLWVSDVERGASTRLTHSGTASSPVWSADGRRVFYAHRADGAFEIWARDADAAGAATRLFGGERHAFPVAAAPDGRTLLFSQRSDASNSDIWALPIGGGPSTPLLATPFEEEAASYSPNATLLAFQSTETGRAEIYVQRLRDGRRVIVSADGGSNPRWSSDGLFFESRGRLLRAVIVEESEGLRVASLTDVMELGGRALAGVAGRPLLFRRSDTPRPLERAVVDVEFARTVRAALAPTVSVPR